MKVVHKYQLNTGPCTFTTVTTHRGALLLSVRVDDEDNLVAYFLVDTNQPHEQRSILVAWTGRSLTNVETLRLRFVDTVCTKYGIVYPCFEATP